jgi:hypothetical protein
VQSRLLQWNGSSCNALESAHPEKKFKMVSLDLAKKREVRQQIAQGPVQGLQTPVQAPNRAMKGP